MALTLVERGAHVFLTRRDKEKLQVIVEAINYIKPVHTIARVTGMTDNEKAAQGADIVIGATDGIPVVTSKIVKNLAPGALVIDAGKGTLYPAAIRTAEKLGITIYRLDVSAAFEGQISKLHTVETIVENRMGRRVLDGVPLVSGGVLGRKGEIVVDNVYDPKIVYGVADGTGDFVRKPVGKHAQNLLKIQKLVTNIVKGGKE